MQTRILVTVLALAAVAALGADVAKATPRTRNSAAVIEDIARYYSGGNLKYPVAYTWTKSGGTTGFPGSGSINLSPQVKDSLDAFFRYGPKSQRGMVLGALGLSTLIHEALHNRANTPDLDFGAEPAPTDLGWRLIPDALHRFFGIRQDSPWGRKYTAMVLKQLRPPG